jgi:hypothetical protein
VVDHEAATSMFALVQIPDMDPEERVRQDSRKTTVRLDDMNGSGEEEGKRHSPAPSAAGVVGVCWPYHSVSVWIKVFAMLLEDLITNTQQGAFVPPS